MNPREIPLALILIVIYPAWLVCTLAVIITDFIQSLRGKR